MDTKALSKKKKRLLFMLYGLILLSLLLTFRLADWVGESMEKTGTAQVSALSDWIEGIAFSMPVWGYVVIFLALAVGMRLGMGRYYRRLYEVSRRNLTPRERYTHINRYNTLDPAFSRDAFAEMLGKRQELLVRCAKSGDFSATKSWLDEKLYAHAADKSLGFGLEMSQLELSGFVQEDGTDTMSVLVTCSNRSGFGKRMYEWLLVRPSGMQTLPVSSYENILEYGAWLLQSVKPV